MNTTIPRPFQLSSTRIMERDQDQVGIFSAMGGPCEIILDPGELLTNEVLEAAASEARRIEQKFSRYLTGNIIHEINTSKGAPIRLDEETSRLLDFADQAYQVSEGLFDITSGVFRQAWVFDGRSFSPDDKFISELTLLVGWNKVRWDPPVLQLKPGMEIDFGGLGKEYAVDRVCQLLKERCHGGILVNFGGDISVSGQRKNHQPWRVGLEDVDQASRAKGIFEMKQGSLATSGDARKYVLVNGKRLGHILNPKTGWPVAGAPRSVTVAADTCTQAGFFSTLGILQGTHAESFLKMAGVTAWCQW